MLCALSGQVPSEPVVSPRSGCIFERSIIEAYVQENHQDPINGDPLESTDLISVTPQLGPGASRTPELASIPALMKALQSEYTGLVLESYTLRKQLRDTEIQLAEERERNDASLRVIARLQSGGSAQLTLKSQEVESRPVDSVSEPTISEDVTPHPVPTDFSPEKLGSLKSQLHKERKKLNAAAKHLNWNVASSNMLKGRWVASHQDNSLLINSNGSVQLNGEKVSTGRTVALKGDWAGDEWLYWTKTQVVWGHILKLRMDGIQDVRWHPSNNLVVLRHGAVYAISTEGETFELNLEARAIDVHPDGEYIIYADDERVKFWSLIEKQNKLELDIKDVNQIRASPNGYLVALATPASVAIVDLRKDDPPTIFETTGNLTWHELGRALAVSSPEKSEIWVMEAGGVLERIWEGIGAQVAAFLGSGDNVQIQLVSS